MTRDGNEITQDGEIASILPDFLFSNGLNTNNRYIEDRKKTEGYELFEFRFEDFHCLQHKSTGSQFPRSRLNFEEPFIQLCFCLEGHSSYYINQAPAASIRSGYHNLSYFPAGTDLQVNWDGENLQEFFIVYLRPSLFEKYFPLQQIPFRAFKEGMEQGLPVSISTQHMPVLPEMRALINDICFCKRASHSRHYYIKAKLIELLLLQAEQSEGQSVSVLQAIREDEFNRICQVRDILHQHPEKEHTLVALAHQVGTNDATLKKQFKQVFGTTVFNYLTNYRMQLAKQMLMESKDKIVHVAQQVGYKHATHFSAAFKRHFGYLPTRIRSWLLFLITYQPEWVLVGCEQELWLSIL